MGSPACHAARHAVAAPSPTSMRRLQLDGSLAVAGGDLRWRARGRPRGARRPGGHPQRDPSRLHGRAVRAHRRVLQHLRSLVRDALPCGLPRRGRSPLPQPRAHPAPGRLVLGGSRSLEHRNTVRVRRPFQWVDLCSRCGAPLPHYRAARWSSRLCTFGLFASTRTKRDVCRCRRLRGRRRGGRSIAATHRGSRLSTLSQVIVRTAYAPRVLRDSLNTSRVKPNPFGVTK